MLDVDDTLYLERDYVRSGFRAVGQWAAEASSVWTESPSSAWQLFLEAGGAAPITDAFDAVSGDR